MKKSQRRIIIIKAKTKVEELNERFGTESQANFYIAQQQDNIVQAKSRFLSSKLKKAIASNREVLRDQVGSGDVKDYQEEHDTYQRNFDKVVSLTSRYFKVKVLKDEFVPSYLFAGDDIIIVVGRDGLVANVAKYVPKRPIIAINPDPERYDGVLLPFHSNNFEPALTSLGMDQYHKKEITMGEVVLDDGQRLLAFNDFFIGADSHVSAKYQITHEGRTENHSSSGIIISTGAGSTAWLSSLFNMAICINQVFGQGQNLQCHTEPWNTRRLVFIVREPFLSKTSQIGLGAGLIREGSELVLESFMPTNGIIFSDGVQKDFIRFNTGSIARIGIAPESAWLVI